MPDPHMTAYGYTAAAVDEMKRADTTSGDRRDYHMQRAMVFAQLSMSAAIREQKGT